MSVTTLTSDEFTTLTSACLTFSTTAYPVPSQRCEAARFGRSMHTPLWRRP